MKALQVHRRLCLDAGGSARAQDPHLGETLRLYKLCCLIHTHIPTSPCPHPSSPPGSTITKIWISLSGSAPVLSCLYDDPHVRNFSRPYRLQRFLQCRMHYIRLLLKLFFYRWQQKVHLANCRACQGLMKTRMGSKSTAYCQPPRLYESDENRLGQMDRLSSFMPFDIRGSSIRHMPFDRQRLAVLRSVRHMAREAWSVTSVR